MFKNLQLQKFGFLVLFLAVAFSSISAKAKNGILLMPHLITPRTQGFDTKSENQLLYYGGSVISQPQVVTVFWNNRVNQLIQKEMARFYTDFVNSSQIDWLNEYKTDVIAVDGREGTHQSFQRGTHLQQVLLVPLQQSKNISDLDVRNELEAQVRAGVLPKPTVNTVYMIHFGPEIKISIEGMSSCSAFGGYHNNGKMKELGDFFYSVLPDCTNGANPESTLSNATFVASHELIEAVTDPFPTPGSKPAYPQAWNTIAGEEISDLCAWNETTFKGSSRNYTITKNWSNIRGICFDGN